MRATKVAFLENMKAKQSINLMFNDVNVSRASDITNTSKELKSNDIMLKKYKNNKRE